MLIIRPEKPEDISEIRKVNVEAFDAPAEADLVDLLRRDGEGLISLVAAHREQIVGHILFSAVFIECPGRSPVKAAGLAPMSILPAFQRQGVGSRLVAAGLEACLKKGYSIAVVLGHPDYYPRFGFVPAERHSIGSEFDAPAGVFMVKELRKDALQGVCGTVKYHKAFRNL